MDAIEPSTILNKINMEKAAGYFDSLFSSLLQFSSRMLLALLVLWVAFWIIKRIFNVVDHSMSKRKVETTLRKFLLSILNISLKSIALIIFASMIGVETTSLIALLGAAGLAVGLALQGSLANFAGGIIILFFRPFKAGDIIEAQGFVGKIEEIQIFNTILITFDNRKIFIPNGLLSNGCLVNDTSQYTRRVDMKYGVSYQDYIPRVREVIKSVLDADDRVLKSPAADIFVGEHADSSVIFFVRPWVKTEDYWPVYFYMHEQIKLAFDREGISIPFPQRDIHMIAQANQPGPASTPSQTP